MFFTDDHHHADGYGGESGPRGLFTRDDLDYFLRSLVAPMGPLFSAVADGNAVVSFSEKSRAAPAALPDPVYACAADRSALTAFSSLADCLDVPMDPADDFEGSVSHADEMLDTFSDPATDMSLFIEHETAADIQACQSRCAERGRHLVDLES